MERSIDKLARYIMYAAGISIIVAISWFFKDAIIYILVAGVVSLIGRPLMNMYNRLNIKGHYFPKWLGAILCIVIIIGGILSVLTLIIPIIGNIAKDISMVNVGTTVKSISVPLQNINDFLVERFPTVGPDFKIESIIIAQLQKFFSSSALSNAINSITSFISSFGIGLFSVVFISFFFFKDENLFSKIVAAITPDKHEQNAVESLGEISNLLSRYFLGLVIEVSMVALLNFIGLMFIARLGFNASLGIAFIAGIMNIVPYIGPFAGGLIGTILGITLKYVCATPIGIDVNFWGFVLILVAVFSVTQLVDNFIMQPLIYSNSLKTSPLEVFIIFIMAGHIGGIVGMLIAIPCYSVIRVIAGRFFRNFKFIRRLIPMDENKTLVNH